MVDHLTVCADPEEKNGLMRRLILGQRPCVLSFVNAHAANLLWRDSNFSDHLSASDVILRDGVGVQLLLRLLGRKPGINMCGTDFIPELLDQIPRESPLAVYGTQEPYLATGVGRLRSMGFEPVYAEQGFHEDRYYIAQFVQTKPSVVILAMGMPKQERVASLLKRVCLEENCPALIINGGAVIDMIANRFPRAPLWMQRCGLEWLYRLVREPKRLWRRYLIGNSIFLLRASLMLTCNITGKTNLKR
jgi:exopolysaccharide biosynthesis WecB/TagA/CpsF family protein